MKKIFTLLLLFGYFSAAAFNVHVHKDASAEHYDVIKDATTINFMSKMTSISCADGSVVDLDNSSFSHFTFTASAGVANVALDSNISLTYVDGVVKVDAENVTEISVFGLNGNVVRKTVDTKCCDLSGLPAGTYIVRAFADGTVSVIKIYKSI